MGALASHLAIAVCHNLLTEDQAKAELEATWDRINTALKALG